MKKEYVKPVIQKVELRTEERLANCSTWYDGLDGHPWCDQYTNLEDYA